jgi:hypothetical protein
MANIDQAASGLTLFRNQSRLIWPLNTVRTLNRKNVCQLAVPINGREMGVVPKALISR